MNDSKAVGATEGSVVLVEGTNEVKVTGTAEDGSTSEYKITVVVMPKYEGKVPVIEGAPEPETEPVTEPTIEPESESEEMTTEAGDAESENLVDDKENDSDGKGGFGIGTLIIVIIIGFALGFVPSFIIFKKIKAKSNE